MMAWRGATAGSAQALSNLASEEGRTMAWRPTAPMSFQAWAASPRRWAGTQVINTVTSRPSTLRQRAATKPSPPLLPGPQRTMA